MNKKYWVEETDFYITNVCNLTCETCITYNDRKFKGYSKWEDYRQMYEDWAKILDVNMMVIIGGEPYSHPELLTWAQGIRRLWPDVESFAVCTNGTYFHLDENKKISRDLVDLGLWIDVSVHDPSHFSDVKFHLEDILSAYDYTTVPIKTTTLGRSFLDDGIEYQLDGRKIAELNQRWTLHTSSTKMEKDGMIYMHTSDPQTAHDNCSAYRCHYFNKGKLYKCHVVAVGEDLTKQFNIDAASKEMLLDYRACTPYDDPEFIEQFTGTLLNVIPQCTLCPEKRLPKDVFPLVLKKR
jgi:hypothetical protein